MIFLDYLTGIKVIVPENLDFQYSKNFLCTTLERRLLGLRFLGLTI